MALRAIAELNLSDLNLQDGLELAGGVNRAGLVGFANIYGYLYPRPETVPALAGLTDGLGGWDGWVQLLAAKAGRCILRARFGAGEVTPPGAGARALWGTVLTPATPLALGARVAAHHREDPAGEHLELIGAVNLYSDTSADGTLSWPVALVRNPVGYRYRAKALDWLGARPDWLIGERVYETFGDAWEQARAEVGAFAPMMRAAALDAGKV
jgi:hypothetical protein